MDELEIDARARRRQLDGRPDRDRDRPDRARAGRARSGCCAPPSPGSSAASTRSCGCCAPSSGCCPHALPPLARSPSQFWSMFSDRDADRPGRRRPGRRRVPAHLPHRRRALRLPRRGPQHLPRGAVRPQRLLPAARRARAARAVRLGHPRPADPAGLQPPRRASGCPSAEQVTLDDCGHVPQVERPEETNELLLRLLRRAPSARTPAQRAGARLAAGAEAGLSRRSRI